MRPSNRLADEMRSIQLELGYSPYAEGSCLVRFGNTHVLCTATVEEKAPPFAREIGSGWVTAEYGMLPRSTHKRTDREASRGKQSGRTLEIQRLIGRSLRAITDLKALGDRQVRLDCDVIQADGGTRTASITGAYLALYMALASLKKEGKLPEIPLTDQLAAISCGVYKDTPILDLDYDEDSAAEIDANFVFTGKGHIVEVQATAEQTPFTEDKFHVLFTLAQQGVAKLITLQKSVLDQKGYLIKE